MINQNNRPIWPQNIMDADNWAMRPRCASPPPISLSRKCCEPIRPSCHEPTCRAPVCPPPCPPICEPSCCDLPACPPGCKPPAPALSTPHIVCCGREASRCLSETICVSGLQGCGLCPPFMLKSLEVADAELDVCIKRQARGPSSALVEVTIPLVAWVCDASGRISCGNAQVTVCVRMPTNCVCFDGALMAAARVRLIDAGCANGDLTFCVRLDLVAEVFLVRIEPCARSRNQCPPFHKPMFPQPQPFYPF